MKKEIIDALEKARAATNKGNGLRHSRAVQRQKWDYLRDDYKWQQWIDEHWKPASKEMRKRFRAEFKSPKWKGLYIEFPGRDYTVNGRTGKVGTWFTYRVFWHGLWISKSFSPESLDDIIVETWHLGAMLVAHYEKVETIARLTKSKFCIHKVKKGYKISVEGSRGICTVVDLDTAQKLRELFECCKKGTIMQSIMYPGA